jgi:hypothetical protein
LELHRQEPDQATPDGGAAAAPPSGEATPASDLSRAPAPIIEPSDDLEVPTRVLDPRADEVLRAMATALAAAKVFAFEAEERFDEIPSGQPRTLVTNVRRVAVPEQTEQLSGVWARPNRGSGGRRSRSRLPRAITAPAQVTGQFASGSLKGA